MTSRPNFLDAFFQPDFAKNLPSSSQMPFDLKSLMDSQRKTIQALTEAQQIAINALQSAARRQGELITKMIADQASLASQILSEGTPEAKAARQADLSRKAYEKSVNGMREVTDILCKAQIEASDLINKRIGAALAEVETSIAKPKKAA